MQSTRGRDGELWAARAVAVRVVELAEDEGAVGEDLVAPHQELGAGTHLAPVNSGDRYADLFQDCLMIRTSKS